MKTIVLSVHVDYEPLENNSEASMREVVRRAISTELNVAIDNGYDSPLVAIERVSVSLSDEDLIDGHDVGDLYPVRDDR
jgi:hypothetical protein